MKNKMYICIGKLVEINLPIHISSVIERCPVIEIYFEPVCQNNKEQRFFLYTFNKNTQPNGKLGKIWMVGE